MGLDWMLVAIVVLFPVYAFFSIGSLVLRFERENKEKDELKKRLGALEARRIVEQEKEASDE